SKMQPAAAATQPGAGTAGSRLAPSLTSLSPTGIDVEAPLDALRGAAGPTEKAVLASLAKQLELKADAPVKSARALSEEIMKQQRQRDRDIGGARRRRSDSRRALRSALLMRWPELSNILHPRSAAI